MSIHDNRYRGNFDTSFRSSCLLPAKAEKHTDPVPKRDEPVMPKSPLDPSSITKLGGKKTEPVFSNLQVAPASILKYRDDWSVAMLETGRFGLLPSPNSPFASKATSPEDLTFPERSKAKKKDCVSEQKKQQARKGTGEYNICEDDHENISHLTKQTNHLVNTDNARDRFVGTTADKKYATKDTTHSDRGEAFQNQPAMQIN